MSQRQQPKQRKLNNQPVRPALVSKRSADQLPASKLSQTQLSFNQQGQLLSQQATSREPSTSSRKGSNLHVHKGPLPRPFSSRSSSSASSSSSVVNSSKSLSKHQQPHLPAPVTGLSRSRSRDSLPPPPLPARSRSLKRAAPSQSSFEVLERPSQRKQEKRREEPKHPSSDAVDHPEGMSQLSQLPLHHHVDHLPHFMDVHKTIFNLQETPVYAPIHQPLPKSPSPPPPSSPPQPCLFKTSEAQHDVKKLGPIGADDSGIDMGTSDETVMAPLPRLASRPPSPPESHFSSEDLSPPEGFHTPAHWQDSSSQASSASGRPPSFPGGFMDDAGGDHLPDYRPPQPPRILSLASSPQPQARPEPSPSPSRTPPRSQTNRTFDNQKSDGSSSATENSSPAKPSPPRPSRAVKTSTPQRSQALPVLVCDTPSHLRISPIKDAFSSQRETGDVCMDPALQETMAPPPPPRSPAKRLKFDNISEETSQARPKVPSGDDLHIDETPAVAGFANVQEAFAGSHVTLHQRAQLEQSRLDGFFGVQPPKDTEKESSIRALSQHILTQQKRRLEDHQQDDEEALVASSQSAEVESEHVDVGRGDERLEDEVIPETQDSVKDWQ